MHPDQSFNWEHHPLWRVGPETEDGFWLVKRPPWGPYAVRVIEDDRTPLRTPVEFRDAIRDAEHPEYRALMAGEDTYLEAISVVATVPADELIRLRDAVLSGKAGGANDGAPRRRTRKAAQS